MNAHDGVLEWWWESEADGKERILDDVFGAKEVISLQHGNGTCGQEELHWGGEE